METLIFLMVTTATYLVVRHRAPHPRHLKLGLIFAMLLIAHGLYRLSIGEPLWHGVVPLVFGAVWLYLFWRGRNQPHIASETRQAR